MFKKDQRAALYFTMSDLVHFKNDNVQGMAFPVVEFSREGYKIRKVFG